MAKPIDWGELSAEVCKRLGIKPVILCMFEEHVYPDLTNRRNLVLLVKALLDRGLGFGLAGEGKRRPSAVVFGSGRSAHRDGDSASEALLLATAAYLEIIGDVVE